MATNPSEKEVLAGQNIIGAILFFGYIVAALVFTGIIVLDIGRLTSAPNTHDCKSESIPHDVSARCSILSGRPLLFSVAATISFAALSFNMLSFLVVSYSTWSLEHHITLSQPFRNVADIRWQLWCIWSWATNSNLFETFAKDLLSTEESRRWTVLALLYHYGWNSYMSVVGEEMSSRERPTR